MLCVRLAAVFGAEEGCKGRISTAEEGEGRHRRLAGQDSGVRGDAGGDGDVVLDFFFFN